MGKIISTDISTRVEYLCNYTERLGVDILNTETSHIGGFTGSKTRLLLSLIGAEIGTYLEIGSHRGATFCSTVANNKLAKSYAVDNFSEFDDGTVRDELQSNIIKYAKDGDGNVSGVLIEKDSFSLTKEDIKNGIDFYFYDGDHSKESQKKGITYFKQFLSPISIIAVDDYNWEDVQSGTQEGIKESLLEILYECHLGKNKDSDGAGYWNGLYIAVVKK